MKAVGNIKRITRTMQMIATSKFARAQQAAVAGKPFNQALNDLVGQLTAAAGDDASHPLLKPANPSAPALTLIITSDRGLCGPYNGSVIRLALSYLRKLDNTGRVEVVGKKGAGALKFSKVAVKAQHTQFGDKPGYADVQRLADQFIDAFTAGEVSSVTIVSMRYLSAGSQKAEVRQLLPFDAASGSGEGASAGGAYEFSPDAETLLGSLLPAAVRSLLFQSFNDAVVSEHVARMIAMKAATDNAGKMGHALKRKFNRVRQTQITTELTEIISGAAALE
ncbi:MAG: F-type H+-transporting ATPase subunit gamma [Phycisphaerales bacterium]|jgi:F-type H+-transporting ATPase subunit gamma